VVKTAINRIPNHRAKFFQGFRLGVDSIAKRSGAKSTPAGLGHLKNDFGTHTIKLPVLAASVKTHCQNSRLPKMPTNHRHAAFGL